MFLFRSLVEVDKSFSHWSQIFDPSTIRVSLINFFKLTFISSKVESRFFKLFYSKDDLNYCFVV